MHAFFTGLKNTWLERKPDVFSYGGGTIYPQSQSIVQQPIIQS